MTSVKILRVSDTAGTLIDGGSNVCATGDLNTLLDVTDITPIDISVAIDGVPSSIDDKITKQGLLPLTASTAPTWLKPLYPPRPFLLPAMFSTFGIKKVARTPWYQVASDLPVATASSPCTLIFSNVTASTTAQWTCTQWIMTPSASLVTVRKPHLPLLDYLPRNLSPPRRLDKLNLRFGCYGMAPPANANLTCYHHTLSARHQSSNIIPFDQ
jgi:hypothetical protein